MSWNSFPPPGAHHGPPPPGGPFWDFINSFDPSARGAGYGVDHTNGEHGFAFGPGGFNAWSGPNAFGSGWGRRGRGGWSFGGGPRGGRRGHGHHGPHHRHGEDQNGSGNDEDMYDIAAAAAAAEAEMETERDAEKDTSPATAMDAEGEHPDPPEEIPSPPHRRHGRCGRRGGFGHRGRGGPRGHSHHGPPFGGPPFGGPPFGGPRGGTFDFNAMLDALTHHPWTSHPFAQRIREYIEQVRRQAQTGDREGSGETPSEEDGSFTPPIDIFNTPNNWTIHLAIPGAKKEDIGVNWDADHATLTVSGVVHRPGDEEFINSMISGERKVGLFERKIQLPPTEGNENKDEVDGDHITAKMEDGILIVVVPKVEKEWTEIKKVDIL
jgi:HSP20 family protein